MQPSQNVEIHRILEMCCRRKGMILAVGLIVSSLALYLALSLPNIYRSGTLILITPQKLPSNYISSTATMSVEQRVQAITRQILSRTSLETIIIEFNLFSSDPKRTIEERVEALRKRIKIDVGRNDAFELSFRAFSPDIAMQVTERLASLFIEENLRAQEQQAEGTTSFINAEADRLRKELEGQEARVNHFKATYRYELPEQLDANLRTLDQFRRELESGQLRLSALEDRKAALEKQVAEMGMLEMERASLDSITGQAIVPPLSLRAKLEMELEALLRKYSEQHPDVVRLRREIKSAREPTPIQDAKKTDARARVPERNSLKEMLASQISDVEMEMNASRIKHNHLRDQIALLRSRVENTPLRAMDLAKITRDYDITLKKYIDLQAKGLDSQLSANMERNNKGEQFQVVDKASFPEKPMSPNRGRIVVMGLVLGLIAGLGLAFLLEALDTSLRKADEVESFVGVPLLAAIPAVATRGLILEKRHTQFISVLVSLTSLIVGVGAIRVYGHLVAELF